MKDIDAQLMMEALRPNDRRDAYRGQGVDPETGEKLSGDEHAKCVQWTKDIKAKLAQAQSTGDSKLANKLQRYLDMHGIDEADDQGRPERMYGKQNFMHGQPASAPATGQVAPELDAAAGGDFISHLNSIEFTEEGAAALVEWLARYNLGAS